MAKNRLGLESYDRRRKNKKTKEQDNVPLRLAVRNISSQRNNARGGGRVISKASMLLPDNLGTDWTGLDWTVTVYPSTRYGLDG